MANFNWDDLRVLMAVDEAGTLLGAARRLGVSHSTVHRRLDAAEQALGVRLFQRRGGRLMRTDAAQDTLGEAQRIGQDIAALARTAGSADADLDGVVRVAAPLALATQFLTRNLRTLRVSHPGIRVILRADLGSDAMLRGEADIGLRISMPVAERLDIRRIGDCQFGLYASPKIVVSQLRALHQGGALPGPYLTFSDDYPPVPETEWIRSIFRGSEPVLQANATLALVAAAQAGLGVAALAKYAGENSVGLRRIPVSPEGPREGLYLVTHREQRSLSRVRLVVDFIETIVRSHPNLFS
jgi:DNA-binding transcriptional LysR family regulator